MATYTKQGDVFLTRKKFEQLAKNGQLVKGTIYHLLDASFAIETIEGLSTKLDLAPLVEMSILTDGDNVYVVSHKQNIYTGTTSEQQTPLQLANATQAGLMSSADYATLANLTERVHALEGKTTRILYTASNMPSAEEIDAFATSLGYEAPYRGVAIIIDNTFHVWHYYENDNIGWRDDGLDAVNAFTNNGAGTIRGAQIDGKVFAETDGTGSVFGWAELKARVANLETGKQDKLVIDEMPQEGSTNVVTSGGAYQHAHDTADAAYTESCAYTDQRLSGRSNPNLFINSDFSINQRGRTSIAASQYKASMLNNANKHKRFVADLWRIYADAYDGEWVITNTSSGIEMNNTNGSKRILLSQQFDIAAADKFLRTPITFSIYASVNGSEPQVYSLTTYIEEYRLNGKIQVYGTPTYFEEVNGSCLRIHTPDAGDHVSFDIYVVPGDVLTVYWAKLEYSDKYTPYHRPCHAEELTKCRQFYQEVSESRLPAAYSDPSGFDWYLPLVPTMLHAPNLVLTKSGLSILTGGVTTELSANNLTTTYVHADSINFKLAYTQDQTKTFVALLEAKERVNGDAPIIMYLDYIE